MSDERLKKQTEFVIKTDKLKTISRQTYLADGSRKENDAEHSYHLALMAYLMREYAAEPVDVTKAMLMALIHDIVEIEAGDTYAYDEAGNADRAERETRAAEHLFAVLPEDQGQELKALWREFEDNETAEAHYVNALDKVQPVLLTDSAEGKSWREHGVRRSWIAKRNARTAEGSPALAELAFELIEKNIGKGYIIDDRDPE